MRTPSIAIASEVPIINGRPTIPQLLESSLLSRANESTVEVMYTDEQLLNLYLRDQRRAGRSTNTIERYSQYLRLVSKSVPGGIARLTREDFEQWLDDLHLSMRTRYSYISYLSTFYDWAVDDHRLRTNVTKEIRRPKMHRLLPRPIANDDLITALASASPQISCYLLLAAYGGLRCIEIAGLQVGDVVETEGLLRIVDAKGGDERIVPLHPEVLSALVRLPMPRAGFVFRGARGDKVSRSMVSQKGNQHLHNTGTTSTMHTLRHWFGSHLYSESEGDIRMVQEALGHKDVSSTAIYTAFSRQNMTVRVQGLNMNPSELVGQAS